MATHSSILAWRIRWTEEPGGIQSMGSQKRAGGEGECLWGLWTVAILQDIPWDTWKTLPVFYLLAEMPVHLPSGLYNFGLCSDPCLVNRHNYLLSTYYVPGMVLGSEVGFKDCFGQMDTQMMNRQRFFLLLITLRSKFKIPSACLTSCLGAFSLRHSSVTHCLSFCSSNFKHFCLKVLAHPVSETLDLHPYMQVFAQMFPPPRGLS